MRELFEPLVKKTTMLEISMTEHPDGGKVYQIENMGTKKDLVAALVICGMLAKDFQDAINHACVTLHDLPIQPSAYKLIEA